MRRSLLLAILLLGSTASAQDAFDTRHAAAVGKNPAKLSLSIQIAEGRTAFRPGERIPIEMTFGTTEAGKYEVETHPVLMQNWWFADHEDAMTRPGAECGIGGVFSVLGGSMLLDRPVTVKRDANAYLRFQTPGRYRLYIVSYAVHERFRVTPEMRINPPARRPEYPLTSNIVTFTILPADAAWTSATVSRASAVLQHGTPEEKLEAARTLRFIGNQAAVRAMVEALGDGESPLDRELFTGVSESRFRKLGVSLLERRLVDPREPVSYRIVDSLARLAQCASEPLPPLRVPLPDDAQGKKELDRKLKELEPRNVERGRKFHELIGHYFDLLAAFMNAKQGEARSSAVLTLLQRASSISLQGPAPAWLPAVRAALPAVLVQLPASQQRALLEWTWSTIASPALLPVLRQIYNDPNPPRTDPPVAVIALRRIYELSPDEGRRLILAEIENPRLGQRAEDLLLSLPDATLPQFDNLFVQWLKPRGGPPEFDRANPRATKLLARYATAATLPAVRTMFESSPERFGCDAGIVSYFLRYDRPYGEALAHRMLHGAHFSGPGHCAWLFQELVKLGPREAVEKIAIAELANQAVPAKTQAAIALGRVGSPAAEESLWTAFEWWRKWWAGRERGLNNEEWLLERAYYQALSEGRGWVLTPEKAERMERLCISAECRSAALTARCLLDQPLMINPMYSPDGTLSFSIGSARMLKTAELREKLKQFPKGARFELRPASSPELAKANEELLSFAREAGIRIDLLAAHP